MDHIGTAGGRFITVLPRTRREDGWFRDWICRHRPIGPRPNRCRPDGRTSHPMCCRCSNRRRGRPRVTGSSGSTPPPRKPRDATTRAAHIERAERDLATLAERMSGAKPDQDPRPRPNKPPGPCWPTPIPSSTSISTSTTSSTSATPPATPELPDQPPPSPPNPHPSAPAQLGTTPHAVRRAAASDGCWPLVTNDTGLTPTEVLAAYRYQPHLERRHHCLKGAQAVAPMHLHSPARIEALLCCHFLALLTTALIERQTRTAMTTKGLTAIGLYPEDRDCPAPSAARILDISPASAATTSTKTAASSKSSTLNSTPDNAPCCDCSASARPPTNTTSDPHPHPDHLEHPPPSHQPKTRRAGHLPRPPPHHLPHALGWKNGSTKAFVYQTAILDHPSPPPEDGGHYSSTKSKSPYHRRPMAHRRQLRPQHHRHRHTRRRHHLTATTVKSPHRRAENEPR